MRKFVRKVLMTAVLTSIPTLAGAASLQVGPVSLEIPAPGATATVKLRNDATTPLNAQLRVFRWTQENGEEKLEPTNDVVASPPIARLPAKSEQVVRLVRLSKQPIAKGESYRLLVDELPDSSRNKNRVVAVVLRYSIPVFFYPTDPEGAKLVWSVSHHMGRIVVSARNDGDRHVRLANLRIHTSDGTSISFGNGLTGYALGHSTMRWSIPSNNNRIGASSSVTITAQGDSGPISASTVMQSAR